MRRKHQGRVCLRCFTHRLAQQRTLKRWTRWTPYSSPSRQSIAFPRSASRDVVDPQSKMTSCRVSRCSRSLWRHFRSVEAIRSRAPPAWRSRRLCEVINQRKGKTNVHTSKIFRFITHQISIPSFSWRFNDLLYSPLCH